MKLQPRRCLPFLLLLVVAGLVHAQDLNDFKPLANRLPIPDEFITPASTRFKEEAKTISKDEKSDIKKDKKIFYLQSNYVIDYILKSGKVLFNEEVYVYLNKVAAKLLEQKPELKDKLHIYPIKMDEANAFTFNEGYIFVNIGLIARLDNEAELAFILAHEITHYEKKHSIKRHIKMRKLRREGENDEESLQYQLKRVSRFSRENEFDADLGAFAMLQASPYKSASSVSALEMLYIGSEPVEAIPFDKKFIEAGTLRLPQRFFDLPEPEKDKDEGIEPDDEEEQKLKDSLSSHPAIDLRIKAMKKMFDKKGEKGSTLYLAGTQNEFEYIKNVCRFEMTQIYTLQNNFPEGIYHNYLLQKAHPNNRYLQKNLSILLGKLAIRSTSEPMGDIVAKPDEIESDYRVVNQFCYKVSREELNLVAFKLAWLTYRNNKEDEQLKNLATQLGRNYKTNFRDNLNDFESAGNFNDSSIEVIYSSKPISPETDKKGRIKKQKNKGKKYVFEDSFAKFALSDLADKDTAFVTFFDNLKTDKKTTVEEEDGAGDEDEAEAPEHARPRVWADKKKTEQKVAEKFKADKILIFEPSYSQTDFRKDVQVNYVADEKAEAAFRATIVECARQAKLNVDMLAANEIAKNDIEGFNAYCVLKDWIREISSGKGNFNIPSTNADLVKQISDKYGARYLALTYNASAIRRHAHSVFWNLVGSVILLPANPALAIGNLHRGYGPDHQFELSVGIFDLYENKIIYYENIHRREKNNIDLIKSQLYAYFLSIKSGKK